MNQKIQQCRIVHDRNYTVVSNGFIRDKRLSLKGKGLLLTVLSLNDNEWDFSIRGICAILKEGKTAVYNVIDELIELGYCSREQLRDEISGKMFPMLYTFYEVAENQPHSYSPNADGAYTENETQLNTNNKEIPNKEVTSTSVDVPSENATAEKRKKNLSVLKEKKEKTYTVAHRCRLVFEQQYLQKKGETYYYAAKDAAALKQIIDKIKSKMPDDEKENDESLVTNFTVFIQAIVNSGRVERWVLDNLSLPVINSKFNEIYSQLKNGTAKHNEQQSSGVSDEYIRRIAAEVAANGGLAF